MADFPSSEGSRAGHYVETTVGGEVLRAFVPFPLPPKPPIDLAGLIEPLVRAERALGRLDGVATALPSHELFLYMFVRKEALLSSQIEGTQSSLDELLRFELDAEAPDPVDDVREVSNYVNAMAYGVDRLKTLPLSIRLVRELHERLLQSGRGRSKLPGEIRRSQNWIGGTRPGNALFVPPPVTELPAVLGELERFMHEDESKLPLLVKAGLLHVQFETIHPFLDGNGRVGRLLITLYLCANGLLRSPLLYLSLYFKENRAEYYRLLQDVRVRGVWEQWLAYFLDGVERTATQAYETATRIIALFDADTARITASGARAASTLRVYEHMKKAPMQSAPALADKTGMSEPTINAAIRDLRALGVVEEVTGRKKGRIYAYRAFVDILAEGTDPL